MNAESRFRIDRLSIRNYKGIDELDVDFPRSPMADDPDVVALGSRNGVGKSSVLECCALLLAIPRLLDTTEETLSISNIEEVVRAGEPSVEIGGRLRSGNETTDIRLTVDRDGTVSEDRDGKYFDAPARTKGHSIQRFAGTTHFLPHVLGHIPDPTIFPDGLLFHSFRRVYQSHLPPDSIFKKRSIYDVAPFGRGRACAVPIWCSPASAARRWKIYSRFQAVETAEGRAVGLPEYLEKVWEVVGRAALETVLGTAEAQALSALYPRGSREKRLLDAMLLAVPR